jgi:hypothetical protein
MGTVTEYKNLRIVVNSKDHNPPHVHVVERDGSFFRVNLEDFSLMDPSPYTAKDTAKIIDQIRARAEECWAEWRRFHGQE